MKLKKYEAATEQEAIEMVKDELGMEALILNIKKIQPQGVFSIFKKPHVEVTAAYEDKIVSQEKKEKESEGKQFNLKLNEVNKNNDTEIYKSKLIQKEAAINQLEEKLNVTEELLEQVMGKISASTHHLDSKRKYDSTLLQFFYDTLISQGVTHNIAEILLEDIENVEDLDKLDINLIVKIVYNRIINILGEPNPVVSSKQKKEFAKNIVFIGPTGVGKTTTIAKLSSYFLINEGVNVSFITADTYRIAAVEQLKTYAEILGSDVGVVYNKDDLIEQIDNMRAINDLIFIDTAGRSHKNRENIEELKELLDVIPEPEVFLVLSTTTKYEDLLDIIRAYSEIADFKLIFTKLDETTCLGSILNICYTTHKKISYASNGQNVPDDLEIIKPEKIAKALLGSMYE